MYVVLSAVLAERLLQIRIRRCILTYRAPFQAQEDLVELWGYEISIVMRGGKTYSFDLKILCVFLCEPRGVYILGYPLGTNDR